MTVFEFEQLLGCPREHLEFALWYLKGKGYVTRGDNGRFTLTVPGSDEVESPAQCWDDRNQKLLEPGAAEAQKETSGVILIEVNGSAITSTGCRLTRHPGFSFTTQDRSPHTTDKECLADSERRPQSASHAATCPSQLR